MHNTGASDRAISGGLLFELPGSYMHPARQQRPKPLGFHYESVADDEQAESDLGATQFRLGRDHLPLR